ncbi:hypothetical protein APSETT444_010271 [Aspergillus pseudonomiae]
MENRRDKPIHANRMMRVICIGAGPSGLYLAYMFKTSFTDYTLEVYERNEDIGGTWFENRYPGCTCDLPSHMYTYSFEPKWDWSASYASAPEVHSYFSGFADKHGLRDFINCNHRVVGSNWDDANSQWKVRVENANKEIFEKSCFLGFKGRDDTNLAEAWEKEPRSYLGVAAHGFPNYFMLLGPNSPLANSPVIVCIEAQGHYIARFLNRWQKEDIRTFEPKVEAVDDFMEQKDLFMKSTVWESDCRSWFKNANTGKVSGLWPGSGLSYIEALAVQRFEDFHVTYAAKNRFAYLGNGFSQTHLQPESDLAYYVRHEDNGESVFPELMSVDNAKDTADSLAAKEEMNWLL